MVPSRTEPYARPEAVAMNGIRGGKPENLVRDYSRRLAKCLLPTEGIRHYEDTKLRLMEHALELTGDCIPDICLHFAPPHGPVLVSKIEFEKCCARSERALSLKV